MDSTATLIVAALAAGGGVKVKDPACSPVKDAYEGLEARVKTHLAGRPDAELILAGYNAAPEAWERLLIAELTAAGVNAELVAAAQTLMALIDASGVRDGKYTVDNEGSQGVQVGDYNIQNNTYIIGSNGTFSATLADLSGNLSPQPAAITRAPRTEAERQQVLQLRPVGWEYLYFAGQLLHERDNVESKYRDHEICYASANGEVVGGSDLAGHVEVLRYTSRRAGDAVALLKKLTMVVSNTASRRRAFEEGDTDRIAHLAKRWNSVYEEFLDWAASMRGVSVPREFRDLLQLTARIADQPVEQYRLFVNNYIAQVDELPEAIAAGKDVTLEAHLNISIPGELMQAYYSELARLDRQIVERFSDDS